MAKLKFVTLQKIAALAINLSFLLQNILSPLAFLSLAKPVMAGKLSDVEVSLKLDQKKHEFELELINITSAEYDLNYHYVEGDVIENIHDEQTSDADKKIRKNTMLVLKVVTQKFHLPF